MTGLRPAIATSAIGIALLWSTMAMVQDRTTQDRSAHDRPAMVGGRPVPAVQGVWRSRGYGYLVRIDQEGPKLFHVAGAFCYADPRPGSDPEGLFTLYRPWEPGSLAFSSEPGATRYVFDRLPDLPPACTDPTPWTASRIAALVAATFADLYPSFAERGIDWQARTSALALDDTSNDAALFETLATMLAGVDDPHVELHAGVAGERRVLEPGDGRTLGACAPRAAVPGMTTAPRTNGGRRYRRRHPRHCAAGYRPSGRARSCVLGPGWRYRVSQFLEHGGLLARPQSDDTSLLDTVLDQAITAFKGARAVIVDVTNNHGGYDDVARHIAGRFADRRRLAYTKVGYGAQGVEPQPFHVEPSKRVRYLGPVYLLTSDVTLSAAETFALYMRALPNVVHVGETTRGAFSDVIEKPLPNGWKLNISAEIHLDPHGRSYEARGLPPQIRREVFPPDDRQRRTCARRAGSDGRDPAGGAGLTRQVGSPSPMAAHGRAPLALARPTGQNTAVSNIPIYQALAHAFAAEGVDTHFTLMGDGNMHWAAAMKNLDGVRTYCARHEHCACAMAIGYYHATGKVGVASVTCGPGFTQIMTALAVAARARIPLVIFAGETPINAKWYNQAIDQPPLAAATGAHYISAHSPQRMHQYVREAFHVARHDASRSCSAFPMIFRSNRCPTSGTTSLPPPSCRIPSPSLPTRARSRNWPKNSSAPNARSFSRGGACCAPVRRRRSRN